MSKFGFSFEERISAEGANSWFSYDFITGMHSNSSPQIIEVTGRRLPTSELPPWVFTTDHGGWSLPPERGGGASVIGFPIKPIDFVPHAENLVKAIVSRDPIGVIEVGVSIFLEMAARSRIGHIEFSQMAIP